MPMASTLFPVWHWGEYTVSVVDPTPRLAGTKPGLYLGTGRYKTIADVTIAEATGPVTDELRFRQARLVGDKVDGRQP